LGRGDVCFLKKTETERRECARLFCERAFSSFFLTLYSPHLSFESPTRDIGMLWRCA
jgi:hypothetical protein